MKNAAFVLAFLALVPVSAFAPPQQVELTNAQLVGVMRFVNTFEYGYFDDKKQFASVDELLGWLKETGKIDQAPLNLSAESLRPYELRIAATDSGKHYQISMIRLPDLHDKSTWCKAAGFTDDRGIIFLGMTIGCEDMVRTEPIR